MILADLPISHIEPRYSKQRPSDLFIRWLHLPLTNKVSYIQSLLTYMLTYLPTYVHRKRVSLIDWLAQSLTELPQILN